MIVRPTIAELAVRVLRLTVERARSDRIIGEDVRLALRCLLPLVTKRALLVEFWTYAGQLPHANRADSCAAVLADIVEDLRAAGRYPPADIEARRMAAEAGQALIVEREMKSQVQRRHYFAPPRRRT